MPIPKATSGRLAAGTGSVNGLDRCAASLGARFLAGIRPQDDETPGKLFGQALSGAKPRRLWRRTLAAAKVALAAAFLPVIGSMESAAAPVGIVGQDNRELFDADTQPELNAVGRLNREGGGFCSAVLISPKEILTAAHCVWDNRTRAIMPADRLHFVPGYRRGTYLGHARGNKINTVSSLRFATDGRSMNPIDDWAIITLDLDITAATGVRPIPLAGRPTILALTDQSRLIRVGYGADRPHLPVKVAPCSARALIEEKRLLVHDCDATYGDSGSPIMISHAGKLAVVGVHSAIATYDQQQFGVAVVLARLLEAGSLLRNQVAP